MKSSRALVCLALGWFFLGAAGFFSEFFSLLWLYSGLCLLPFVIVDGILLVFFTDRLRSERTISPVLAQGENAVVKIDVFRGDGFGGTRFLLSPKILLWDLHPLSMETAAFPALLDGKLLSGRNSCGMLSFEYSILPVERGRWFFQGSEFLLSSPLRLWRLKVFCPCESRGRTYPDFKKIVAHAGADLRGLLERTGVKNIRMRGQGLEYRSLRDYQDGDSIRAVDWRATSRRRKVIIREYQEEQDQQVLFLLDSGYRLHRQDDTGRLQFDNALEAVLLLSWVSLKFGDSVAVGSFGSGMRWISPQKGISSFPKLMNGLFDLASSPSPSSPFAALEEALSRLKRRTFIIIVSNFREEDGESLSWILRRIAKQHLLLLVSLKESESEILAARKPTGDEEALETAAAFAYLASRRELYNSWEHLGLLTLEASADKLSGALINRYLSIKRQGRL